MAELIDLYVATCLSCQQLDQRVTGSYDNSFCAPIKQPCHFLPKVNCNKAVSFISIHVFTKTCVTGNNSVLHKALLIVIFDTIFRLLFLSGSPGVKPLQIVT